MAAITYLRPIQPCHLKPFLTSCSRHDSTYIRGWMQMVSSPNDLFSWNNNTMSTMLQWVFTLVTSHARWHLLYAWSFLEDVMGSSSLLLTILLCPAISPVRTQLMLTGPYWGPRPPTPRVASLPTGSGNTPLSGSRTLPTPVSLMYEKMWHKLTWK